MQIINGSPKHIKYKVAYIHRDYTTTGFPVTGISLGSGPLTTRGFIMMLISVVTTTYFISRFDFWMACLAQGAVAVFLGSILPKSADKKPNYLIKDITYIKIDGLTATIKFKDRSWIVAKTDHYLTEFRILVEKTGKNKCPVA